MSSVILDASALLAFLNQETGFELVEKNLLHGVISAVNLAEVVSTLSKAGVPDQVSQHLALSFVREVVPFDHLQALQVGVLRTKTKDYGLSLADRACIALAIQRKAPILTADRIWAKLTLPIKIILIR